MKFLLSNNKSICISRNLYEKFSRDAIFKKYTPNTSYRDASLKTKVYLEMLLFKKIIDIAYNGISRETSHVHCSSLML